MSLHSKLPEGPVTTILERAEKTAPGLCTFVDVAKLVELNREFTAVYQVGVNLVPDQLVQDMQADVVGLMNEAFVKLRRASN